VLGDLLSNLGILDRESTEIMHTSPKR